jgi:hypothetical protein
MSKHVKRMSTSTLWRTRRFQVVGVIAVVIVFAMAAMAISIKAGKVDNAKVGTGSQNVSSSSGSNSPALRFAPEGHSFSQAQIRPLTQEEAQQLAEGIKSLVNQSTDGLKQVQHPDGSVSMDLEGRFQNVALAKRTVDGNLAQSCVDNPESAAAFLGIDRELIDGTPSKNRNRVKPVEPEMPGKGQNQ